MSDTAIAKKIRAMERRRTRERICTGCRKPEDREIGPIHSSLPCERCGAEPCHGFVVGEMWLGPSKRFNNAF